ncbi:MAG: type II toxin-antitoxin system VapC family toxin [candidate division KSB1 bacterium]|nr:type II toxin-antitoxin system VapC family toxin [candidate division KSB1 bacterium]MDQ7064274.1 type II toxin-antitoxin system VapC family toxin [candidate division KSB1 bacterium]
MIGLDSGFFIKLLQGDEVAAEVWEQVLRKKEEAYVSCLTLFELERLGLKAMIDKEAVNVVNAAIKENCELIWIDDPEIIEQSSRLSHGLGMPSVSALILAGFLVKEIKKVYTTDRHFQAYRKKKFEAVVLSR